MTVKIDFLFLDESVCKPCGGTSEALSTAFDLLKGPLDSIGINMELRKIHVTSEEVAVSEEFLTSPTIRVNGKDIDPAQTEDDCPTCGDLAGGKTPVTCRNWHWHDKVYDVAPVGKIVEEIMKAAVSMGEKPENCCSETEQEKSYTLPENLKGFFAAKERNETLCC